MLETIYRHEKHVVKDSAKNKILGAIHIDGSSRVQTVNKKDNPYL